MAMNGVLDTDAAVKAVLAKTPVVPVMVIDDLEKAVPLAGALLQGGVSVLEITLRTPAGLPAIAAIKNAYPEASVGAGTVTSAASLREACEQGADFIVSPGLTPKLLDAAVAARVPLLPGIATISELMLGLEYGVHTFKFFPAEAAGGVKVLKAFAGPFPDICFCPTGGISLDNAAAYLALPSVLSVGGSWLCPADKVAGNDWAAISQLARETQTLAKR